MIRFEWQQDNSSSFWKKDKWLEQDISRLDTGLEVDQNELIGDMEEVIQIQ